MADIPDELELSEQPEEEEVYVKYDIATYPSDYTLGGIHELWEKHDIVIPDYQRDFVWTIKQSSLLIESFLLGLPVPPVFFYIDESNKNVVIDGQQRILSVIFYFDGYFGSPTGKTRKPVFRLKGIAKNSPYNNLRYEDLSEADQRKLRSSVLRAINIRQLSPDAENSSAYHIFERLNTGGTALKPQEIRNCVFRGPIIQALRNLNNDANWRHILGKIEMDRHQKDLELVLRLFALYRDWISYEKPMREFLNKVMKKNRAFDSPKAKEFLYVFPKACKFIVGTVGDRPFHVRGPLNTTVLDAVMSIVLERIEAGLPKDFSDRFNALLENIDFLRMTNVATTDTAIVHERMTLASKILTE